MKGDMSSNPDKAGSAEAIEDTVTLQSNPFSFFEWLKRKIRKPRHSVPDTSYSLERTDDIRPGIWNLRQLRVEDVMIPKADIKSVPVTISKSDLVLVFKESGLTCLLYTSDAADE